MWAESTEAAFERQRKVLTSYNIPTGLLEWVPIKPLTKESFRDLPKNLKISTVGPIIKNAEYRDVYRDVHRQALARHLGPPLKPEGELLPGAPERAHWWASTRDGHPYGVILILEHATGSVFAIHAPPNGVPQMFDHSVSGIAFGQVTRCAYALVEAESKAKAARPE